MTDAFIKFEREELEAPIPVGTYLIDAARRVGIRLSDIPGNEEHDCVVNITDGADLLSPRTAAEKNYFKAAGETGNARLACQAKIVSPGEVIIMTKKKEKPAEDTDASNADRDERFRKEFEEMPLEAKLASLVRLEVIAMSETLSFIANSPFKVVDKLMDVMAEFGMKKDKEKREAARPAEHKAEPAA